MRIVKIFIGMIVFVSSIVLLSTAFADQSVAPLTLQEAYQLALKQSEQIASKQQLIKEAEGQFLQSLSGVLPKVAFNYDQTYKENAHQSQLGRFTLSQPLFSGFKEFAAISGAKAQQRQRKFEIFRAQQLLFIDVADSFYLYWLHLKDQEVVTGVVKALQDQANALEERVKLGRARRSELTASQARLAKKNAELIQIQTDSQVAKSLLEFLIGMPLDRSIDGDKLPVSSSRDLKAYVDLANKRSDVLASQEAVLVMRKKISVAQAGFWPKVSLDGDYYTKKTSSTPQDWDVTLKFEVPLFQGGENLGNVRTANAQYEQSTLLAAETKRRAIMEVTQALAQWEGAVKRRDAFELAANLSKQNYELQLEDYGHQQINIIDLLQSLADWEESQRDYLSAQSDAVRAWWNLKVKAGDIDNVSC